MLQQQKCCPSPSTRTLKREAHHIFWFPLHRSFVQATLFPNNVIPPQKRCNSTWEWQIQCYQDYTKTATGLMPLKTGWAWSLGGVSLSLLLYWSEPQAEQEVESVVLERTSKDDLVQLSCNDQGHPQLHQVLRAPSSLTLGVSGDGASTNSLGNLCQFPYPYCIQCFTPSLKIKTLYTDKYR